MICSKKVISFSGLMSGCMELLDYLRDSCGYEGEALFYDIETTGLSRQDSWIYLTGAGFVADGSLCLVQYFAESRAEEEQILREFFALSGKAGFTVSFNGDAFDRQFLLEKAAFFHLETSFGDLASFDLYRFLREYRTLTGLSSLRQTSVEKLLGLPGRAYPDGKAGIRMYFRYLSSPETGTADSLLGHNEEDIRGLVSILSLLSLMQLKKEDYSVISAKKKDSCLIIECDVPLSFPVSLTVSGDEGDLLLYEDHFRLSLPVSGGKSRRFYPDYKAYDYLPAEDTAVPKTISRFMEKSLRIPASRKTCYTWFTVNDDFLCDREEQAKFVRAVIPVLLSL